MKIFYKRLLTGIACGSIGALTLIATQAGVTTAPETKATQSKTETKDVKLENQVKVLKAEVDFLQSSNNECQTNLQATQRLMAIDNDAKTKDKKLNDVIAEVRKDEKIPEDGTFNLQMLTWTIPKH